jgi:hypothetical protein
MRLLLFIFLIIILLLGSLQFSGITELRELGLIRQVQQQLLEEHRERSTDQFNKSLEQDTLGKILHRAADIFTTSITLVSTRMSQGILAGARKAPVIVYARYLVENSSEEPLQAEKYMRFNYQQDQGWIYTGNATARDYYKNFFSID